MRGADLQKLNNEGLDIFHVNDISESMVAHIRDTLKINS